MTVLDDVASAHYVHQSALINAVDLRTSALWSAMQPGDLAGSWASVGPQIADQVALGQYVAAASADGYVDAAMNAQGVRVTAAGLVDARALAGISSDGRALLDLLLSAMLTVKQRIAAGATIAEAMLSGKANLTMHVATQIADAGRAADHAAMTARPQVAYWVRMIEPGACSRCALLAGRRYKWAANFQRHPACRCRAIPAAEATGDLTTDPGAYFDSLDTAGQDRIFTKAGAEAIRNGADIARVVNARRGMTTATEYGRTLQVTREGVTGRGHVRLMPEEIFRVARDRNDAVRLLQLHGFIF